jgi:hypothetical protein
VPGAMQEAERRHRLGIPPASLIIKLAPQLSARRPAIQELTKLKRPSHEPLGTGAPVG